jgi:hypothetical protein
MITELQVTVGEGALKTVPSAALLLLEEPTLKTAAAIN